MVSCLRSFDQSTPDDGSRNETPSNTLGYLHLNPIRVGLLVNGLVISFERFSGDLGAGVHRHTQGDRLWARNKPELDARLRLVRCSARLRIDKSIVASI